MAAPNCKPKVLCFGSINIDHVYSVPHIVYPGETISSVDYKIFPGGKGANQSVALAKGGAQVFHAGCIGEDGAWLVRLMESHGVNTRLVKVDKEKASGQAFIQVSPKGENSIVLHAGANHAISDSHIADVFQQFLTQSGEPQSPRRRKHWLVCQNELQFTALERIIAQAGKNEEGMWVVFNPAPAPIIVENGDGTGGAGVTHTRLWSVLRGVHVLIMNETEAETIHRFVCSEQRSDNQGEQMEGDATRYVRMFETLFEQLPNLRIVVLTMGSQGVVSGCRAQKRPGSTVAQEATVPTTSTDIFAYIRMPCFPGISVVDTTGAGDAFVGSVVARLVDQDREDEDQFDVSCVGKALRYAVAASGMACEKAGAMGSVPGWQEVRERMGRVGGDWVEDGFKSPTSFHPIRS
ncbi:hypothetical protein HK102_001017 [Quaeritorhiza haematococci]|nr:hypothetical protein HK102_001017 [Quaeritorhiza haematococci]